MQAPSRLERNAPQTPPTVHQGYPDPALLLQQREARAREERQLEREHQLRIHVQGGRTADTVTAAWQNGRECGFREGFTKGADWGIVCGAVSGVLVGAIAGVLMVKLGMWWPF